MSSKLVFGGKTQESKEFSVVTARLFPEIRGNYFARNNGSLCCLHQVLTAGRKNRFFMLKQKDHSQENWGEDEEMVLRAQRGELSVDFLICCFFWCSCIWWV